MPWWFPFGFVGIFLLAMVFDGVRSRRRARRETKRALECAARDELYRLLEHDADVQEGLREVDRMFPLHEPVAPVYSMEMPPLRQLEEAKEAREAEDPDALRQCLMSALSQDPFVAQAQRANQTQARAALTALSNAAIDDKWAAGLSNAAQGPVSKSSAQLLVELVVRNAVSKCQECERELRPASWRHDYGNDEVVFAWHCHRAETETRCDYMAFELETEFSLRRAREALVPPVLFTKADQSPVRRNAEVLRVLSGGKS